MSWAVSRETNNPNVQAIALGKATAKLQPGDPNRQILVDMIQGVEGSENRTAKIRGIFPKFLKISNSGKVFQDLSMISAFFEVSVIVAQRTV